MEFLHFARELCPPQPSYSRRVTEERFGDIQVTWAILILPSVREGRFSSQIHRNTDSA
jgi:hypothetical protein